MRIALAGSGQLATGILESLLDSHHTVAAVIQNGRKTSAWNRRLAALMPSILGPPLTVTGLAKRHRIPILFLDRMTPDQLTPLARLSLDLMLVAGFGVILKRPVLDLPRLGCVNCHSALLPRHRGPNPFAAVILEGETQSGVTFHVMTEGIDDGSILAQYPFALDDGDTALTVYQKSTAMAAETVLDMLDPIEAQGLDGTPQDPEAATYDAKASEADLIIRWDQPVAAIDRLVRAYSPFSPARFRYKGHTIYVERVEPVRLPDPQPPGQVLDTYPYVTIAAADGAIQIVHAHRTGLLGGPWPGWFAPPRPGDRVC